MKKILIVSNSIWNVENFRRSLINKFLDLHYKIDIIVPFDKKYSNTIAHKNIKITYINFRSKSYFIFLDFLFIYKLSEYIKKNNPHYVLSFTVKPNLICGFLSRFYNYKCICNVTGLGTLFLRGNFIKTLSLLLYKICFKKVNHVFFHNITDKKIFIKNLVVNDYNSSTIPGSGVNLNYFHYDKKEYFKNKEIVFLYLGRIMKDKGISEYIKAIETLKTSKFNIKFIFAGTIDNKNKNLNNKFNQLIKNNKIIFYKDILDVRNLLKISDCIVLPSYREGLSKSLLEASATGRPMLVSNVPGCNDIVDDGVNGFLFKSKNYKSLQNCLIKFINLPEEEKNLMAKNSYMKSFNYDEKIIIDKYLNLLN